MKANEPAFWMDELKPCPFCGEQYVVANFELNAEHSRGFIRCPACGACGPEVEIKDYWKPDAIKAWTSRGDK